MEENGWWIFFLTFFALAFIVFIFGWGKGYKRRQIDGLQGEYSYKLIEQSNGELKYKKVEDYNINE